MTILPLLLSVALFGAATSPYPIEPCSLKTLCEEADLIVRARVHSTARLDSSSTTSFATLDVVTVLHGDLCSEQVEVTWRANMMCPEPARYTDETSVIAFLNWNEAGERYSTCCLSYGLKELDEPGLASYAKAIERYFEIQAMSLEEEKKDALILDWLVDLAIDTHTRWEGAYELAPSLQWSEMRKSFRDTGYYQQVTGDHIRRLKRALWSEKDLVTPGNLTLVNLMSHLGDPDLPPFLLKYLEERLADTEFRDHYSLAQLMQVAAGMKAHGEAMVCAAEYGFIILKGDSNDRKKAEAERLELYRSELTKFLKFMQES